MFCRTRDFLSAGSKSLLVICLGLLISLGGGAILSAQSQPTTLVDSELVVKLRDSDELLRLKFTSDTDLAAVIKNYQRHAAVELVERNAKFKIAANPTDSLFSRQNYLQQIKAPAAWDKIRQSPDVTIAVLDTGVDIDHPDLHSNIWKNSREIPRNGIDDDRNGYIDDVNGWDFVTDSPDPRPKFDDDFSAIGMNHGTLVAGIAAAEGGNGRGVAGVTWSAQIMPLRVLSSAGEGDTISVSQAINYAVKNGADIINMSFVGDSPSSALAAAIEDAYLSNVLVITAAGNEEGDGIDLTQQLRYPVCHDGGRNWVIGVTSVDSLDRKTSFANFGHCIDISAPGTGIYNTQFTSPGRPGFESLYGGGWNGTSLSAPQVAGAAALILAQNGELPVAELQEKLLQATDSINRANPEHPGQLGSGRLNLFKAVSGSAPARQTAVRARITQKLIVTGAGPGGGPHVRVFNKQGTLVTQFFAAENDFRGGVNVALGDFNGDAVLEVAVAPDGKAAPWVRIFSLSGELLSEFMAFENEFQAGVQLAAGDIDGDSIDEIVAVPNRGGTPQVRIFDINGALKKFFFAYHESVQSGVKVAVGDLNSDGIAEIVTAPGPVAVPLLKIFDGNGRVLRKWLAFEFDFLQGFSVSLADNTVVVTSRSGGPPRAWVYDQQGRVTSRWLAYGERFQGGVRVALADIDEDGLIEVITTPGPSGGPHLRIFDIQGNVKRQWMAYSPAFAGGVSVSVSK